MNRIFLISFGLYCVGCFSPAAFATSLQPVACTPKPLDLSGVPNVLHKRYEQRAQDMLVMDTNCNGALEAAELNKSASDKFNAADINKNGMISEKEAEAMIDNFKENSEAKGLLAEKRANALEEKLTNMDTNKDKSISPAEYSAFYTSRYSAQDKNKDGVVDIQEYRTDTESRKKKRND